MSVCLGTIEKPDDYYEVINGNIIKTYYYTRCKKVYKKIQHIKPTFYHSDIVKDLSVMLKKFNKSFETANNNIVSDPIYFEDKWFCISQIQHLGEVLKKKNLMVQNKKIMKNHDRLSSKYSNALNTIKSLKEETLEIKISQQALLEENKILREELKALKAQMIENNYLEDYSIMDKYICDKVQKETGFKRNFYAGIKNNIKDFVNIDKVNEIIKKDFNITLSKFITVFRDIKIKRVITAHPQITLSNKSVKKRIRKLIKRS
tara:strand:+ start:3739 stop:4521 length:783 start_codon:yes stop_codon:yes gene_type:complete